jgi:hypothetical protein
LSSFHNKSLAAISKRNGWYTLELKMASSMTHGFKTKREKIEVLTANYPISVKLEELSKKQLASGEEEARD